MFIVKHLKWYLVLFQFSERIKSYFIVEWFNYGGNLIIESQHTVTFLLPYNICRYHLGSDGQGLFFDFPREKSE